MPTMKPSSRQPPESDIGRLLLGCGLSLLSGGSLGGGTLLGRLSCGLSGRFSLRGGPQGLRLC